MTLGMLPMPVHADEIAESPSVTLEEPREKVGVSSKEVSADITNQIISKLESDTAAKEPAVPGAEAPVDTAMDSSTTTTEKLIADVSEATPVSATVRESEAVTDTDTTAEDTEIEENAGFDSTVDSVENPTVADSDESENPETSESNTQEESEQMEFETKAPVFATFSVSRNAISAAATECEHPVTEVAWDTNYRLTYTPVNNNQHRINGYQNYYCTSCYKRVGESFAATELDNHELDTDGDCNLCGYSSHTGSGSGAGSGGSDSGSDPNCEHKNTAIGWDPGQLGPWYAQLNAAQHKVTGFRYTYCTDCGDRIRDESGSNNNYYSEEVEGHTLNASGVCTLCGYGYEPPCNHYIKEWSNSDDISHYEQFDEDTHYTYRFRYATCSDCGEELEDTAYSIRNESHVPENGVCIHCGCNVGEDYCAHSERDVAWDTNHPITYNKFSNTHHKVTGYQYMYCTSCFDRVRESFAAEEYEEHSLNTSGNCSLCGYASSENTGCAHENTEEKFYYENPVRYAQFNEDEHYIYRAGTIYCHDCRTDIGSSNTELWNFEAHTLNDEGNCIYCGYGLDEGYCTHPDSKLVLDTDQPKTYYKKDENQHLVNFYQYHYCPDCNSRISESFLDATWEDHNFDTSGVCTLCGEVRVCPHPADAREDVALSFSYLPFNDTQHQKFGSWCPYCTECNQPVGESFPTEVLENHVLDASGVCNLCSYDPNCKHENVIRSKPAWFAPRYSQFNDTEHWVYRVVGVACVDCDTNLPNEEESSLWPHVLNDAGVCTYCGYGSDGDYCTHPTTAMAWDSGTTWEPFDDATHIAEGYRYHYCTVCSERISENSYWVDASEEHVLNGDGVCTICGFGAPCAHESMETVTSTQLVNQSLTHHTVETTTYEECTICHEKINEVTNTEWVEHTPIDANSYGYEAAHDHKKYFICECGAHPYLEGQHETANGAVQEPDVCCICHGHKYGEEEETPAGTRQKTCANCGLTTVTHTHDYKLVKTTELVIQSETHHTVETTTYEECSECHKKTEPVENVVWEEHKAESSSHEAEHPHQKYFICKCGAHPYIDGEYETANGKVQEKSVCCICNGHKYGEAKEAADGTWKKTCANCGLSQKVAAPVQPTEPEEEKHIHRVSTTGKATSGHPHTYDILCVCGEVMGSDTMFVLDCCQCVECHDWADTIRLADNSFKQLCSRCNASRTVTPSSKDQDLYKVIDAITYRHNVAKDYQEDYLKENGIDNHGTNVWKTIASQASDQLLDVDFVTTAETIDTIQKGLLGIAWDGLTYKDWDEQQTEAWKMLLLKMLEAELENELEEGMDIFEEANGMTSNTVKVLENVYKDKKEYFQKLNGQLDANLDVLREKIDKFADADPNSNALSSVMMDNLQDLQESMAEQSEAAKNNTAKSSDAEEFWKGLGWVLKFAEYALDGIEHAYVANNYRNALTALNQSAENITILEGISKTAAEAGNTNLADAADELRKDMLDSMPEMVNSVVSASEGVALFLGQYFAWGFNELAKEAFTGTLKAVSDTLSNTMDILGLGAAAMDLALGWGPVYDEAQLLMTYNMMDVTMDITDVLKNVDATEAENAHYMTKLWGVLQTEGCLSAQKFLDAYDSARKLDIEALGFDNDKELSNALGLLKSEHNYFVTALSLPLEKIN